MKWVYRTGQGWRRRDEVDPLPERPEAPEAKVYDRAHVSSALPRKGTGIENVWDKFTDEGKPYFENDRDVREFRARAEGAGEPYGYDG